LEEFGIDYLKIKIIKKEYGLNQVFLQKMKYPKAFEQYNEFLKKLNKLITGRDIVLREVVDEVGNLCVEIWKKISGDRITIVNELAYVIGVLLGDGCIIREHKNMYDIELKAKDYEFIEVLSRDMAKILNKKFKKPYWSKPHNLESTLLF